MTSAVAGNSTWSHFPALGDELRNHPDVLVIDLQSFIGAKPAHFTPEHWPPSRWPFFVLHAIPVWPRAPLSLCHRLPTSLSNCDNRLPEKNHTSSVET